MTLGNISERALSRTNFATLEDYFAFATAYLQFMDDPANYQAEIVCQNEVSYRFYQYKADGGHNITRPINNNLWLSLDEYRQNLQHFKNILADLRGGKTPSPVHKPLVSRFIYTTQQAVGASLDSLGVGRMQNARKLNGDVFEQLIRQLVQAAGVDCVSGVVKVDIKDDAGAVLASTTYQHDLLIRLGDDLKIIGSVKTSSKDRIDRIFIDKYLYGKLTGTSTPHIAIFLNDVQRGKAVASSVSAAPSYKVASTFLPGKFKAYTLKLNPLDGVYYCDLRPNMTADPLLSGQIRSIDELFYTDLHALLRRIPLSPVQVQAEPEHQKSDLPEEN